MNNFDSRAREWDKDKMHMERSTAIAAEIERMITIAPHIKTLEYGSGTGALSFLLKDRFSEITLMDSSQEMINVCIEKVEYHQAHHIKPIWYDLEHNDYAEKFDVIYHLMVLHHVNDVESMLQKFYTLLNPGGYLAIADLYAEDGSFHGPDVKVHWGFDPDKLTETLKHMGFKNIEYKTCFEVKRESGKSYPIFLLVAKK
jgi:2-polyprenyl-3-methyl-5-hydroxy-6-metoxy-1,4-benzoquinol methylase